MPHVCNDQDNRESIEWPNLFTRCTRRARRTATAILDDVTLSFYPGAKIGVVGPNGMGKSTLLKLMAGMEEASNGEARLTPGYTVGILQQEPPLDEDKTVLENIELAFGDVKAKIDRFNEIGGLMAEPDADFDALMAEMGELQDAIDAVDGWDLDSQLSQAMDALQCPDPDMPVNVLSGGERRRVALCRLLLEAPDLLLLDEPTNHLDAESVLWLEQFLHKYQGAVLAVTHDRYFLDNVAEWICEVDREHLYPYKGNYTTYLETKAARLASQKQRDERLAKRLSEELEWVRSSPKARQAKSRARLERYDQMVAEAAQSKKVDFTEITSRSTAPWCERAQGGWALQELWRLLMAHRQPVVRVAAQRHRGRDRPERRGQVHALQDDRRQGAADLGYARAGRDGEALLRRPGGARASTRQQERVGSGLRRAPTT